MYTIFIKDAKYIANNKFKQDANKLPLWIDKPEVEITFLRVGKQTPDKTEIWAVYGQCVLALLTFDETGDEPNSIAKPDISHCCYWRGPEDNILEVKPHQESRVLMLHPEYISVVLNKQRKFE